jgi:alpha-L-fucosidase
MTLVSRSRILLTALSLSVAFNVAAQTNPDGTVDTGDAHARQTLLSLESPEAVAKRLEWWSDARFGMFIHWGLYAQWGCHYPGADGKLINGRTEHMMRHIRLPFAVYSTIAHVFNPVKFDADEWVRVARDAGMKYMVITSKHHDGFAIFDSPSNDYNIMNRTPWKRDAIKELAEACRRQGLKFGVYYSLGRDWEDPDVPTEVKADGNRRSNDWDWPDETKKDFSKYFERKVKPQIRELLTQYGPIAVLWFDTPERITRAQSEELVRLIHSLQPDCIVTQRVGKRLGDYAVREQEIPATGEPQPWETCMTLNRHWGYYLGDENWKPTSELIRNLIDITSKGGNFLLNVGPTGEGIIPGPSVERLRQVGEWMKVNGEAIYGTSASPLKETPAWGRVTRKTDATGTTLYLHVLNRPADGKLIVPGVSREVESATLLNGGATLRTVAQDAGIEVSVPETAPNVISTTVVLKLRGQL